MKTKLIALAALGLLFACTSRAQTTYPADHTPFKCNSVTTAQVEMSFYSFNCRGIFFVSKTVELTFNGETSLATVTTPGWTVNGAVITNVQLTQPSPTFCKLPSTRIAGCPDGSTPGTFSFAWSGTGTDSQVHSGTVQGTWYNLQYFCSDCRSGGTWYAPTLETVSLTINE